LLLQNGSSWLPMTNTVGAEWEVSNFPEPPFDLMVTSGNSFNLLR
jgi:hypothetical protein